MCRTHIVDWGTKLLVSKTTALHVDVSLPQEIDRRAAISWTCKRKKVLFCFNLKRCQSFFPSPDILKDLTFSQNYQKLTFQIEKIPTSLILREQLQCLCSLRQSLRNSIQKAPLLAKATKADFHLDAFELSPRKPFYGLQWKKNGGPQLEGLTQYRSP